ncbi:translation initiation factor IF-2 subunit beta [Candidatus Woesearchaeota archaeon]|nr:MAG: translation initiation factor IF-2 subunit beta [Candidatus Woesearchaeota archaeon]
MDFKSMVKKAKEELPEKSVKDTRFEIPKVRGHIQGNRTVISNFFQIAGVLHRDVKHVLKYVLKELAAPGEITKTALIIGSKVPASRINEKIRAYAEKYVICKECGKPDTKLMKEGPLTFIKCLACGAKQRVI